MKQAAKKTGARSGTAAKLSKIQINLGKKKVSADDMVDFTEGLSILVSAGLPLDYALETLVGLLEKKHLKALAGRILEMVRQGYSLSYAMGREEGVFTEGYVGMVRAGEASGTLPLVLDQLGQGLRRAREMAKHIISSLMYPGVLLMVSIMAVMFILTWVLPSFVAVFQDMRIPLPTSAKVLMWVGKFLEENGWILLVGLLVLLLGMAWALKQPPVRLVVDRIMLGLGPAGRMVTSWQTVLYTRTLGLLVKGGVPLNEACVYASGAVTNNAFRAGLEEVSLDLKEGKSLTTALMKSPHIPHVVIRMVALGDETGNLGVMLLKTAEYLEERLKTALNRAMKLIEPLIILTMGIVVGGIVVTMLTTVLSLTQGGF